MICDVQKAPILKRIAAGLLDLIVALIIGTGVAYLSSTALKIDDNSKKIVEYYNYYEETYDIKIDISKEEYSQLTEEQKKHYIEVDKIIRSDVGLGKEYQLYRYKMLLIILISIIVAVMISEFAVPLIFKNGQTIGKKIFSLVIVRDNSVKISNAQLFIRTLLGKCVIELIIPAYIIFFIINNLLGIIGLIVLFGLLILELGLYIFNKNRPLIHDIMAYTVVADRETQMIFETNEDLVKYKEMIHLESLKEKK